jgi:hypothetical protein
MSRWVESDGPESRVGEGKSLREISARIECHYWQKLEREKEFKLPAAAAAADTMACLDA